MLTEVVSDRGDGPCVVYVPGIDGTGELLFGTAGRLEERFRLIRLRYVSGVDRSHETYPHLAESLIETVGLRGVESMILVAESFGGAVAMQAALDFPTRVRGIVLVNTFPHFRAQLRLALSRLGAVLLPQWAIRWGRDNLAPWALFGRLRSEENAVEFRSLLTGWRLDRAYRARLGMVSRLDLRPRLGDIGQPTLLVAGTDDWVVDSVRQGREMQSRIPNASLETVAGGGHLILPLAEIDWVDYVGEIHSAALARPGDDDGTE